MKTWSIVRALARDFLSFEQVEIPLFTYKGITIILGNRGPGKSNGCLSGDTLVDCPRDLTKYPKGIPIKELVGKQPWVYAWVNGEIVIRKASKVWLTKRDKVIRVKVSPYATRKGGPPPSKYAPPQEIVGTSDHPVLLSTGEWCALGELKPGDSVCSLYRRESGGWRTIIYWTGMSYTDAVSEQQFVCGYADGDRPFGFDAHHKNENPYDHSVENLEWKGSHEHKSEHTSKRNSEGLSGWQVSGVHPRGMLGKKHTAETLEKIAEAGLGRVKSKETCLKLSKALKGRVFSEETIKKMRIAAKERCAKRKRERDRINHTVLSIEDAGECDVYDMRVPGADNFIANGMVVHNSGKTTIFDLVTWVLYGVTTKKLKSPNKVIRRSAEDGAIAVGTLHIEMVDDGKKRDVVVERTRSARGTNVRITGLSDGTCAGTQEVIDKWFGSVETHFSTRMFSGEVSSFCRLTDANRKELLEHMLEVSHYLKASDRAKELCDTAEAELLAQAAKVAGAESALTEAREERQRVVWDTMLHPLRVRREETRLRLSAIAKYEKAETQRLCVAKVQEDQSAQREEAEKKRDAINEEIDALEAKAQSITEDCGKLQGQLTASNDRITALRKEIADHKSGEHPPICPTCNQRWATDGDPDSINAFVLAKEKEITALRKEAAPIEGDRREMQGNLADIRADIRNKKIAVREVESSFDERVLRSAYTDYAEAEAECKASQEELAQFQDENTDEVDQSEIDAAEDGLRVAKEEMAKVAAEVTRLEDWAGDLKFWRKGFSRTGIPSFLLDSSVPAMNRVLHEVANDLTEGELTLRFNPTASKGSQTIFEVEASYADGGEGFDAASNGERTRIDLATLFAIRDLAESRSQSKCSQLFLDEIMDGTDEHFAESCMRMLRKRYADRQIFVISHDPVIANMCDKQIIVTKKEKVATVS